MANFRIHEDTYNYFPSKNAINSKIPVKYETKVIQQKTFNLKGNIPMKRLPLRPANNISNKNDIVLVAKNTQELKQVQNYVEIPEVITDDSIERKLTLDAEIFHEISQNFNKNKEIYEYTQETREKFHFSLDYLFLTTADYHTNILEYLLYLEQKLKRPKTNYMQKQPELNYKMRSVLVDWLAAVSEEYNLQPQTLHLAVHYIDYFLSQMSVIKSKFQLVGAAAMMIAAKYEEIYPPDTKEWSYLTADTFTIKQLLRMEQLILRVLTFDLTQPTAYSFISHVCSVTNLPKQVMLLSMYFSELVLLEGEGYIKYLPSQLAYAAIALARHTLSEKEIWPQKLASITGYSLKQLSPIIKKQHKSFQDSPTKPQQAIQEKYKTVKYERVSLYKPQKLDLYVIDE